MKKLFFLILIELIFVHSAFSSSVDTKTAKTVATNFFLIKASQSSQQRVRSLATKQIELELVHQEFDDSVKRKNLTSSIEPYYYVYNVKDNNGFIIVSANDAVTPILGYAFEGRYDSINQPPAFISWMNNLKKQIKYIKTNKPYAINKVNAEWSKIITTSSVQINSVFTQVTPLLTSTWGQGCYYNTYCPKYVYDVNSDCNNVPVGCVAVAMGQVINYWKYPAACNDIQGYTDGLNYNNNGNPISNSSFGLISGINATTYNWSNMANILTNTSSSTQNNSVAQLLYHCGVAVKMNYGPNASGAQSSSAAIALDKYFNYPASIQNKWRSDYSTTEWKALLTNELDHSRPIYYSGDSTGIHAFVCDGYQNTDYFHFNWGWDGNYNGYFYIENLNPQNDNFNNHQDVIIGISTSSLPIIQCMNNKITDIGIIGISNGNGVVEPGETISIPITLKNIGCAVANNITAIYSCSDTDISITSNTQNWSSIAVDTSIIASNFKFSVSSDCPDKIVELIIKINSNEGYWTKTLKVNVCKKYSENISVAGTLNSLLTTNQKSSISFLSITGQIDARDFKIMRDSMPALLALDLSGATIVAYTGTEGTTSPNSTVYPINTIPVAAFFKYPLNNILTFISIPSTVISIGSTAFGNCSSLTSINIPSSVTSIGSTAFGNCSSLSSIDIPSSVTSIGNSAFKSCSSLTSINIPTSVISIGGGAFSFSSGFITVDKNNLNYSSMDGVLYNKTQTQLIHCQISQTGNFSIPSSVNAIGYESFGNCSSLTSIIIPNSISSIGSMAFISCINLNSIYVNSKPLDLSSAGQVFDGINKTNCTLYVPTGTKSAYQAAIKWKDFVNIVEFVTDVPTLNNQHISIYPNPVIDDFRINGLDSPGLVSIIDLTSKTVLTNQVVENENISVCTLQKGIYILKLTLDKKTFACKLIKK